MLNPSLFLKVSQASPHLATAAGELGCLFLPASDCKVGIGGGWFPEPELSAFTCSPAGMEAGGGAGQLQECHPLCEQTAQCQLVDTVWVKAHAAPGVQVWSSVLGVSLPLGWSDLEAGLPLTEPAGPQAGLGLPGLSVGGAWSGTGLTCFTPPLPHLLVPLHQVFALALFQTHGVCVMGAWLIGDCPRLAWRK